MARRSRRRRESVRRRLGGTTGRWHVPETDGRSVPRSYPAIVEKRTLEKAVIGAVALGFVLLGVGILLGVF